MMDFRMTPDELADAEAEVRDLEGTCPACKTAVGENYENCPICGANMTTAYFTAEGVLEQPPVRIECSNALTFAPHADCKTVCLHDKDGEGCPSRARLGDNPTGGVTLNLTNPEAKVVRYALSRTANDSTVNKELRGVAQRIAVALGVTLEAPVYPRKSEEGAAFNASNFPPKRLLTEDEVYAVVRGLNGPRAVALTTPQVARFFPTYSLEEVHAVLWQLEKADRVYWGVTRTRSNRRRTLHWFANHERNAKA
jgi:hypothetical protein